MTLRLTPELIWGSAINAWRDGQPQYVVKLLQTNEKIPLAARPWLIQLALGKARKRVGATRLKELPQLRNEITRNRQIIEQFEALKSEQSELRKKVRSEGRDARGSKTTDDIARQVLSAFGLHGGGGIRTVQKMKARLKARRVLTLHTL